MAQEFEQVDQTELPYSLEAEQTILGSIFVDASVLSVVLERIKPDSFFNEQHKALFQIIMQMFTSGEKIDIVTVLNAAMAGHIFDTAAEGRAYLGALVDLVLPWRAVGLQFVLWTFPRKKPPLPGHCVGQHALRYSSQRTFFPYPDGLQSKSSPTDSNRM